MLTPAAGLVRPAVSKDRLAVRWDATIRIGGLCREAKLFQCAHQLIFNALDFCPGPPVEEIGFWFNQRPVSF